MQRLIDGSLAPVHEHRKYQRARRSHRLDDIGNRGPFLNLHLGAIADRSRRQMGAHCPEADDPNSHHASLALAVKFARLAARGQCAKT